MLFASFITPDSSKMKAATGVMLALVLACVTCSAGHAIERRGPGACDCNGRSVGNNGAGIPADVCGAGNACACQTGYTGPTCRTCQRGFIARAGSYPELSITGNPAYVFCEPCGECTAQVYAHLVPVEQLVVALNTSVNTLSQVAQEAILTGEQRVAAVVERFEEVESRISEGMDYFGDLNETVAELHYLHSATDTLESEVSALSSSVEDTSSRLAQVEAFVTNLADATKTNFSMFEQKEAALVETITSMMARIQELERTFGDMCQSMWDACLFKTSRHCGCLRCQAVPEWRVMRHCGGSARVHLPRWILGVVLRSRSPYVPLHGHVCWEILTLSWVGAPQECPRPTSMATRSCRLRRCSTRALLARPWMQHTASASACRSQRTWSC